MWAACVPGLSTGLKLTIDRHVFVISMVWLAPTAIAARFVDHYIPNDMLRMKYYENMDGWFPDFVATAPQKGGVGFTKVAGHSLLDYLTYTVQRLTHTLIMNQYRADELDHGGNP